MSGHRSRGAALEYNVTVEEIKDNMKTILGKVNFRGRGEGGVANASKCNFALFRACCVQSNARLCRPSSRMGRLRTLNTRPMHSRQLLIVLIQKLKNFMPGFYESIPAKEKRGGGAKKEKVMKKLISRNVHYLWFVKWLMLNCKRSFLNLTASTIIGFYFSKYILF